MIKDSDIRNNKKLPSKSINQISKKDIKQLKLRRRNKDNSVPAQESWAIISL